MRRREFIALMGVTAACPPGLHAQASMPRVGYLLPGTVASHGAYATTFLQGLGELGLVKDRDFSLDLRYADGKLDRIAAIVGELIGAGATVLAVGSTGAGLAAKRATTSIPIVFLSGDDAVEAGLVASLARPGGNLTGISVLFTQVHAKRLDIILELVPKEAIIASLYNPANRNTQADLKAAVDVAQRRARSLVVVNATTDDELDAAFDSLVRQRAVGLLVQSDPFLNSRREKIVALASRHRLVGNYPIREWAVAGGLSSYGVNFGDSYRQVGTYVGKIIKGAKPADLAVQQPIKFEMVINLKTAKALGLTVPPLLLAQADEVIE